MRPDARIELGGKPLDPTPDGGVIERHPALGQQIPDVSVGQAVAQIPPHGAHDNLRLKMPPFEDEGP